MFLYVHTPVLPIIHAFHFINTHLSLHSGSASARGNKKKSKSPKVTKQTTTPAQKALLDAMAKEQKERDDLKNGVIATVKGENEGGNEVVGESSLLDGVEKDGKIEKEEKKLTFVSSLTFADMILEYFHTEKKNPEGESNLAGLTGSTVSSIQPPPFSPLFSSPSSPSPSSPSPRSTTCASSSSSRSSRCRRSTGRSRANCSLGSSQLRYTTS